MAIPARDLAAGMQVLERGHVQHVVAVTPSVRATWIRLASPGRTIRQAVACRLPHATSVRVVAARVVAYGVEVVVPAMTGGLVFGLWVRAAGMAHVEAAVRAGTIRTWRFVPNPARPDEGCFVVQARRDAGRALAEAVFGAGGVVLEP